MACPISRRGLVSQSIPQVRIRRRRLEQPVFLEPIAQRRSRQTQQPCGGGLVPGGAVEGLLEERLFEGFERDAGSPAFAIDEGRTKIVVLSRSREPAELTVTLRPYPGRPGSREPHVTPRHRRLRSPLGRRSRRCP